MHTMDIEGRNVVIGNEKKEGRWVGHFGFEMGLLLRSLLTSYWY
jgi:hypothetical protein